MIEISLSFLLLVAVVLLLVEHRQHIKRDTANREAWEAYHVEYALHRLRVQRWFESGNVGPGPKPPTPPDL